jgi:hypothetical protein
LRWILDKPVFEDEKWAGLSAGKHVYHDLWKVKVGGELEVQSENLLFIQRFQGTQKRLAYTSSLKCLIFMLNMFLWGGV